MAKRGVREEESSNAGAKKSLERAEAVIQDQQKEVLGKKKATIQSQQKNDIEKKEVAKQ